VTRSPLPLLKESEAGRIVNLASILGSLPLQTDPNTPIAAIKSSAYDASKTAINAFTIHLAAELKDTKIKVNSAHPGWVNTEMGTDAAPVEIPEGANTSVDLALLGSWVLAAQAAASSTSVKNSPGNGGFSRSRVGDLGLTGKQSRR
jgi:NAD(P)-dependent dehydrogenase (short-subunit alcohol dehydrogenase family)